MESCLAVEKEEEKLSKKYKAFREHTESSLDDILKHLSSLREELSKGLRDMSSTIIIFCLGHLNYFSFCLIFHMFLHVHSYSNPAWL